MPKESKESKDSDSVRGKVDAIAKGIGDFSSLIDQVKEQNEKVIKNTGNTFDQLKNVQAGINDLNTYAEAISANISTITRAILGIEIKNPDDGQVLEPTGLGGGDLVATNFILTNISNNIADMVEHILKMPAAMVGQSALQNKESDKEKKKDDDEDDDRMEKIAKTLNLSLSELKELRKDMHKGGILDILVIGAALLSGFVVGLVQKIVSFFAPMTKFFSGAGKLISGTMEMLSKGWSSFTKLLSGMAKFFGPEISIIQKVFNTFVLGIKYFVNMFAQIGKTIGTITELISGIFGKGKAAVGVFTRLATYFDEMFGIFKVFFKAGQALGSVIGKLAIPLTVIMAVWESVSGALDGWNNTEGSYFDKFIAAVKGGLTGLVNSLIGGVLDLLKDGVSWVLGWFGAKDAEAWLDSFSFKDIFTNLISTFVDTFIGFVSDTFGAPIRIFKDMMSAVEGKMDWGDFFKKTLANIVGFLLAPLNSLGKLVGIDITKKVLETMGLPAAEVGGTGSTSGQELAAVQNDNTIEKTKMEEAKMAGTGTAIVQGGQSVTNNISNGGTAVIKSSTTNWEPDDQWARGGMAWGA